MFHIVLCLTRTATRDKDTFNNLLEKCTTFVLHTSTIRERNISQINVIASFRVLICVIVIVPGILQDTRYFEYKIFFHNIYFNMFNFGKNHKDKNWNMLKCQKAIPDQQIPKVT